jgi:hypothetical protein
MKIIKLLLGLGFILNLSSCTITEKMIVNENGSGKFTYDIDGTKMMSMMGGAFKEEGKDSKKKKKKDRPTKDIDSTFTFKEMYAGKQDSISKLSPEEQAKIKKMERFSVRMVMNEEKGTMLYSMFTDFNSVDELEDAMSPVESMKSLSPGGKAGGMGMAPSSLEDNSSMKFFYDGKTFKKEVSQREKKAEEPKKEISEESEALSEELKLKQSLEMFYQQSSYKVVYQFPKAVKKVSVENALYSEDRKTITIEYPLKDYMDNPKSLNFDVEFQ